MGFLLGRNNGQIFSNVITQPSKHNRDVASLEGPRQPSLGVPTDRRLCKSGPV